MNISRHRLATACLLSLVFIANLAPAATVNRTFNAVEDSFIRDGASANSNYGAETYLHIKNIGTSGFRRIAYLQFDLGSYNRADASNAILRLYGHNGEDSSSVILKVYGITDDTWSESAMTWNTGSPNHATSTTTVTGVGTTAFLLGTITFDGPYAYKELNVTSFINGQMADKITSFILVDETGYAKNVVINSSESTANQPELVLSFDDATTAFTATADTYAISGAFASTNYGTSTNLAVRYGAGERAKFSYIKFDLSNFADDWVKRARLSLYAKSLSSGNAIQALYALLDDTWVESTLIWQNSPNHFQDDSVARVLDSNGLARLISSFSATTTGSYIEFDVTDHVNENIDGAQKIFTFILAPGQVDSGNVSFSSRESTQKPQLVVNGSTVFNPTADTYVRNGSFAGTSHGSATTIQVSNEGTDLGRMAYLRFDLSSIASSPGVTALTDAKLRLYVSSIAGSSNSIKLYNARSFTWGKTWSETALNWSNDPEYHDTKTSGYITFNNFSRTARLLGKREVSTVNATYNYDVTDWVNDRLKNGVNSLVFMIASEATNESQVLYASREDTANPKPTLYVDRNTAAGNLVQTADSVIATNGLTLAYGYYGTMPNSLVYSQDQLLSHNGYQYAAYYNSSRHVCVARRALPNGSWEIAELTDYTFASNDTHNNVSLGHCPSDGTLHLSFDHHKSTLKYRRSSLGVTTSPGSTTWSAGLFGGVSSALVSGSTLTEVTYPRFITQPDGNLLFRYRKKTSGDGDGVLFRYNGTTHLWSSLGIYDSRSGTYSGPYITSTTRNAYPDTLVYDNNGRLHTSWVWREGNGAANHDILYAYSDDNGATWRDTTGSAIATTGTDPLKVTDAGLVAATVNENRSLLNDGAMCVDPNGRVHIVALHNPAATPESGTISAVRTYHHYVRETNGTWSVHDLGFSGARPKLLADAARIYLVTVASGLNKLTIAQATLAGGYEDWEIVATHDDPSDIYTESPQVDYRRFMDDGVISVLMQERPASAGASSSLHVLEFMPLE